MTSATCLCPPSDSCWSDKNSAQHEKGSSQTGSIAFRHLPLSLTATPVLPNHWDVLLMNPTGKQTSPEKKAGTTGLQSVNSPRDRYQPPPPPPTPRIFGDNDFWIALYKSFQYLLVCKMTYSAFRDYLRWYIAA